MSPRFAAVSFAVVLVFGPASPVWAGSSNSLVDLTPDGARLLVANSDNGTVTVVDTEAGRVVHKLKVPNEPYGIVTNKDAGRAWVTHEYPGTVSEIDLAERKVVREIKVGAFVRGIALSPDESRLYVTEFYTAILHAVDLKKGEVVDSWKGHSTDNLCRNVVVHPRRPKAYLSV
jgi:YVTN family beta-propeller protein